MLECEDYELWNVDSVGGLSQNRVPLACGKTHLTLPPSSGLLFILFFCLSVSFSFHCLKGLIRGFYNAAANQQTCLLLLPLTWMQQQPSFPFCRLPGEHIKHMPSAPEAMKYKSTNKWISNHKGKKNKEAFKLCGKVTGSSEQFLCFWSLFCLW